MRFYFPEPEDLFWSEAVYCGMILVEPIVIQDVDLYQLSREELDELTELVRDHGNIVTFWRQQTYETIVESLVPDISSLPKLGS